MDVSFSHPANLLLLLLVPIVIFFHFVALKSKRTYALRFSNFATVARIKGIDLYSKNLTVLSITIIIIFSIVLSASGTSIGLNKQVSSYSFVISIDSSGSMATTDILPTRLDAAKSSAINFIDSIPSGTKIGIVSFSGSTFVMQEPTIDKSLLRSAVNDISVSSIGGTDIYDSIVTSSNLLNGEDKKAIILISDGRFNIGNIDDSIKYASDRSVTVHTIAVGTPEGGNSSFGGISSLEQESLRAISKGTGGNYFTASNNEEMLSSFDDIRQFKSAKVYFELSSYLLIFSLVLIVVKFVLVNTTYRIIP